MGQRLDDAVQRLDDTVQQQLRLRQNQIATLGAAVLHHDPRQKLAHARQHLADFRARLDRSLERLIESSASHLGALDARLHSLSPLAVLDRGYALVLVADGALIRSTAQIAQAISSPRAWPMAPSRAASNRSRRPRPIQQIRPAHPNLAIEARDRHNDTPMEHANSSAPTAFAPLRAKPRSTQQRSIASASPSRTRCAKRLRKPKVILGRDTRESGPWIAATLAEGLRKAGAIVESAGVITTPAVAFLARTHGFHAGVVISASHNPWADNGIKLFGGDGFKFPDAAELAMEEEILHHAAQTQVSDLEFLRAHRGQSRLPGRLHSVPHRLRAGPLALRTENRRRLRQRRGCGYCARVAAPLEWRPSDGVTLLNIAPDGRNINADCGALHPDFVAREVKARGADLGITFDGDADRCMLADAHGNVINGDAILLMAARDLKSRGLLTGDVVVATTMSNMGLEAALKRSGIRMLRAPVGDRYVLEMMQKENAALGGEQSGHILFPHLATTGDGLLTALVVLDLVARTGKPIAELTADLKVFPQIIVNVKVREKRSLESIPSVAAAILAAETELKDSGRVVIRYSGTEPLARVMIEAESEEAMRRHAEAIAAAIRHELGV